MSGARFEDLGGRDAYVLLGITQAASDEEIKAAHLRLIRKLHPDRSGDPGSQSAYLNIARDVLLDHEERARYDQFLRGATGTGEPPGPEPEPTMAETPLWDSEEVADSVGISPIPLSAALPPQPLYPQQWWTYTPYRQQWSTYPPPLHGRRLYYPRRKTVSPIGIMIVAVFLGVPFLFLFFLLLVALATAAEH